MEKVISDELKIDEVYYLKKARERVNYNPYGSTVNQIGFVIEVLYLIIRLLCVVIEQNRESRNSG